MILLPLEDADDEDNVYGLIFLVLVLWKRKLVWLLNPTIVVATAALAIYNKAHTNVG